MRLSPRVLAAGIAAFATLAGLTVGAVAQPSSDAVRLVALGDSYIAGNGAGSYSGPRGCYRSADNATARWADLLPAEGRSVSHTKAACSGARTRHLAGQIDEAANELAVATHVVVGIGGNDAHFGDLVFQCLFQRDRGDCEDAVDDATAMLPELQRRVGDNLRAVATSAPSASVLLMGYPKLVSANTYRLRGYEAGNAIRTLGALADSAYREVVRDLNRTDPGRFVFVSLHDTYEGHELGGPDRNWIRNIGLSLNRAEWVHPTDDGYAATARLLASMDGLENQRRSASPGDVIDDDRGTQVRVAAGGVVRRVDPTRRCGRADVGARWPSVALESLPLAPGTVSCDGLPVSTSPMVEEAHSVAGTSVDSARVLAVGDLDGDGFADLAIGDPDLDVDGVRDVGGVTLIPGGIDGFVPRLARTVHQGLSWLPENPEEGDRFGAALSIVDIDGDGAAELVVAIPGEGLRGGSNVGAIVVIDGSALRRSSGIAAEIRHQETTEVPGSAEGGDRWGHALVGLDINGDGFGDIAVGAPGEDIGSADETGAVTVLYGSPSGLRGATMLHQGSPAVPGVNEDGDGWGAVLAAGDLDGDGDDDLVVGTPDESLSGLAAAGSVTVLSGSVRGLHPTDARLWHQNRRGIVGVNEAGDRWGSVLVVHDLDGDGSDEVIIGAPDESIAGIADAGAVTVLSDAASASIPSSRLLHQGRWWVAGTLGAGARWGSSIVVVPREGGLGATMRITRGGAAAG